MPQNDGNDRQMRAAYPAEPQRPVAYRARQDAYSGSGPAYGEGEINPGWAAGGAPMSPVRTLYRADIEEKDGDMLEFVIHGNGFLYHMVRNIVGTVVDVGKGRITAERFREIAEAHDRSKASPTAPACGLYLYEVEY